MKIIVIALLMLCLFCPIALADTSSVFYSGDLLHVVITDEGSTYYLDGNTDREDTCTKAEYNAAVAEVVQPKTIEERIDALEGKVTNLEKVEI